MVRHVLYHSSTTPSGYRNDVSDLVRGVEPLLVVAGELPVHLHHLEEVRLDPGTVKHKLFRRVPETQSSGIRVRLLGELHFSTAGLPV